MKIEIVEFYPKETKDPTFLGTMHAYIIDYKIDIRGIIVKKVVKGFLINMPFFIGLDEDTKLNVRVPYISFQMPEDKKSFMPQIVKEGRKFLKKFYQDQGKTPGL